MRATSSGLVFIMAAAAALLTHVGSAHACKTANPVTSTPSLIAVGQIDTVQIPPGTTTAQNTGIPIQIESGLLSDEQMREKVRVTSVISLKDPANDLATASPPGRLVHIATNLWTWLPSAPLPLGTLNVTIRWDEKNEAKGIVTVEDRLVRVPEARSINVAFDRVMLPAPQTLKAQCELPESSCGRQTIEVPIRTVSDVGVRFFAGAVGEPTLSSSVRVFTTDAAGGNERTLPLMESDLVKSSRTAPAGRLSVVGLQRDAFYCVTLTTQLLDDASTAKSVTNCVPEQPALFTPLTEQQQDDQLIKTTSSCEKVTYPDGYTPPNAESSAEGCSTSSTSSRKTDWSSALVVLLMCLSPLLAKRARLYLERPR